MSGALAGGQVGFQLSFQRGLHDFWIDDSHAGQPIAHDGQNLVRMRHPA